MFSSNELDQKTVQLARSIRGYLTEVNVLKTPRKNKLKQMVLGDEEVPVLVRNQSEIDSAFADLDRLVSVTIPFWLSKENDSRDQVVNQVDNLSRKYPEHLATSYIANLQQSLDEIHATLFRLEDFGIDALGHWFAQNHRTLSSIDELTQNLVVVSPLTTDYLVAALYLSRLRQERSDVSLLYPTGWMPFIPEPTLSSSARKKISEPETQKVVVMVDKNVTGFTSGVISDALREMFEGKEVIG